MKMFELTTNHFRLRNILGKYVDKEGERRDEQYRRGGKFSIFCNLEKKNVEKRE